MNEKIIFLFSEYFRRYQKICNVCCLLMVWQVAIHFGMLKNGLSISCYGIHDHTSKRAILSSCSISGMNLFFNALPKMSQRCSIRFISGERDGHNELIWTSLRYCVTEFVARVRALKCWCEHHQQKLLSYVRCKRYYMFL